MNTNIHTKQSFHTVTVILFILCTLFPLYILTVPVNSKQKLLLVSFDGFRWDYFNKLNSPNNFERIFQNGVKADWIKDSFASVTFPNHYTIVTGLYEESHGIIANKFYDPEMNKSFDYHHTANDGSFYGGEPIWVTNQLQGGKTGVSYWVGSEAEIKGIRPTHWMPFQLDNSSHWPTRVDKVVDWLANDTLDINLALLYFPEPDHSGHRYGPESEEVVAILNECDNITGYLLNKLESRGILDSTNVIITSDHGMATVDAEHTVTLDPPVDLDETVDRVFNSYSATHLWTKPNSTDLVYNKLKNSSSNMNVWKKEDIPDHYHYKHNPRIAPVFVSPHDRWSVIEHDKDTMELKGNHGYNNSLMDMHPIFIAMGPRFRSNVKSKPFENVHIYTMMCEILGLKPAPNNGTLSSVQHILRNNQQPNVDAGYVNDPVFAKWIGIGCGLFIILSLLLFMAKQAKCQGPLKTTQTGYANLPISDTDESDLLMTDVRN